MVKKLQSKDDSPFIAHSLSLFAVHEAFRDNMIQCKAPSALVEMMTRRYFHNSTQGMRGISTLESLIEHDDLRHALFEAKAIEKLIEMLKTAKTKTVTAGADYLFVFAKHYDSAEKMIDQGILSLLVQALGKTDRTVQLSSARVLGMLGMYDDIRQTLIRDHGANLFTMLRGILGDIQVLGAAAAFRALSQYENIRNTVTESVAFSYIAEQYARKNDGVVLKHPQLSRGEILKSNDLIMSMDNVANHDEDLALVASSVKTRSTLKLVAAIAGLFYCCPCLCCYLIGGWALDEDFFDT
ncbi:hypothetical protein SERLA73DRAFT_175255 [Serpula lacrymans var. lacrymans S7.3]|uniref:Uncharacterized protein n=2 Tax=Serpula lacrymans var. lacrymans TaxID=341189 RepID=F8PIP6_SERL3|nr:uncharacterized protein SERLADRAFT_457426 [Serpula lacrymans var. lacrymans S7.9]EGO03679.1 hypothetical protein SERLA73DRAFT_175255 [Serpula lacrymans var. lacrymans S7.3]EGO29543.1 hypothetical protein SERLADRAFT_457426 [Serpula lacrymans var. lacrymans S7.9]